MCTVSQEHILLYMYKTIITNKKGQMIVDRKEIGKITTKKKEQMVAEKGEI